MSNFSFTGTEPVALADNGVVSFNTAAGHEAQTAGTTPQYYAGVVPFIAGLEIFYTVIPTGTENQLRVEVSVHVTGYMTGDGEQRRMLWRGHRDVSTLDMGIAWRVALSNNSQTATTITTQNATQNNTITKITTNSNTSLILPIPVQHNAVEDTYEDIYSFEHIVLTYTDEEDVPHPNSIGLVMFPTDNPGDTRVIRIVNTTLEARLIIGARNIIITDPKP